MAGQGAGRVNEELEESENHQIQAEFLGTPPEAKALPKEKLGFNFPCKMDIRRHENTFLDVSRQVNETQFAKTRNSSAGRTD